VAIPESLGSVKSISYIALVSLLLLVTTLKAPWRWVVLVPTLYLAAFVWENVLSRDPAVTRFILIGAMLVGVMVSRPSGILGERRVEVV
jgi:ABC-type branched-subunit amino acid transport system permease subunit